jgi:hypothetical protein
MQVSYDPESNVLTFELAHGEISYAKEINGTIMHFTGTHVPILLEVLEAGNFITKLKKLGGSKSVVEPAPSPTS